MYSDPQSGSLVGGNVSVGGGLVRRCCASRGRRWPRWPRWLWLQSCSVFHGFSPFAPQLCAPAVSPRRRTGISRVSAGLTVSGKVVLWIVARAATIHRQPNTIHAETDAFDLLTYAGGFRQLCAGPSGLSFYAGDRVLIGGLPAGSSSRPRSWRRSDRAPGPPRRRCDSAARPRCVPQ